MTIKTHDTDMFLAGFDSQSGNPHLWSSDNWLMHNAGQAYKSYGYARETVKSAHKSRGFVVRVETKTGRLMMNFDSTLKNVKIA